jgi:PAS domain S-box-containing protein
MVLELEKNRVEAILRNMGEGVLVTDWSYRIIHANPLALQLLGIEEDLIGQHLFDHIPQKTFSILQEQNIGVRNPTWTVRFNSIGEDFPLVASVAVVDEKEEQTLGLILLLRDISAEKEIDYLKSKFLENVSNHLRNPLASLTGFLDLLREDSYKEAPPRQREYMDVMAEETSRLAEIVEDLLSLSRIELTDYPLVPENFPPSEILVSSMINNQSSAQAKGVSLKSEIEEHLPEIRADKDSILDVANRLLSNAIKYNPPESSVVVGAVLATREGDKGMIEVFVQDAGPGVPDDRREKIFEKYHEHHLFTDSDTPGVGLSLPICKRVIEMNGGRIGVEPATDGGSRFFFTVPVAPGSAT